MILRRPLTRWLLVAALAIAPALVAVEAMAGNTTVRATGSNTWNAKATTVHPDGRVTWRNSTYLDHPITAYGGNWSFSNSLSSGTTVSRTFNSVGVFKFRCLLHSTLVHGVCHGMCGRIVVQR